MVGTKLQYILDANVFLEAYKRYYAFDLCPGFWQSLEYHAAQGILATIDRVGDELQEGPLLDEWKSQAPPLLFLDTDTADILAAYGDIIRWAHEQARFTDAAKASFAEGVDAWLVAFAKAAGVTMVTHEAPAPHSMKIVKIPDVCKAFDITCKDSFVMLRELHVSYYWDRPTTPPKNQSIP